MKPLLKEIRTLIKEIKKINKKIFPIPIENGIYAKPKSALFKRHEMWNFITSASIGYLASHSTIPENMTGYYGCMLSDFSEDIQLEVRDILKGIVEQFKEDHNA